MNRADLLDVDVIKTGLETEVIGKEILVYKSTSSTNDIAWEYSANETNSGLCVFTEEQSSGRGRMGSNWFGGTGESVLCSILLLDCKCGAELLAIASAVATAEAIGRFVGAGARIKWPNDIVIDGKKAAGILLESRTEDQRNDYVIGVGINCHQDKEFFEKIELQMPATSIDIQSNSVIDRNSLARELLACFDKWIDRAEAGGEQIIQRWTELSSQLGHRVTLRYDQEQFEGNCIGVDPTNGLILQLDKGAVRMFDAAHTTILKHT